MRTLLALALLVLAPAARALAPGDQTQLLAEHGIEVRVHSAWPSHLSRGMVPIFVEVSNSDDRSHQVRVFADCNDWNNRRTVEQSIAVGAGQRARLEFLCPVAGTWDSEYALRVEVVGARDKLYFGSAACGGASGEHATVLAVGARDVPESIVQRWIEETSDTKVHSGWAPPGTTATNDNVQIGFARFEGLAANSAAYTSLDAVVLDARDGLPPRAELDALIGWVRGGGALVIAGGAADALARSEPSLAAWMEPRFRHATEVRDLYACGMGRLVICFATGWLDGPELRTLVRGLVRKELALLPNHLGGSRLEHVSTQIPGAGQVPHRVFALLLLVFAVVIGPVNFVLVRRTRRSVLLLITIPAIALATSVLLLAYGILVQGLDVKTASASVACLDQRDHRAASLEKRMLFAGMAPSDGLRPGPGTSVHARAIPGLSAANVRNRLDLRIERSAGTLLSGDYLPARAAVLQILCVERAERARLDVEARGEAYDVTNGLGAPIERLVLRDHAGNYFESRAPIATGARAALEPVELDAGVTASMELLRDPIAASQALLSLEHGTAPGHALPNACYAARIGPSPFRDDCGVPSNEIDGEHALYGVLPLDLEAWR